MGSETKKAIIKALKRLIKELKEGYCECLSEKQIKELMEGFAKILQVEKEVADGNANSNSHRFCPWANIFHNVFSFKKEGNTDKDRK